MDFFAVAVRLVLSIAFTIAVVSYAGGHAGGVTKPYSGPMVQYDGHMLPLLDSGDSVESKWIAGETIAIRQSDGVHLFRRDVDGGEFRDRGLLGKTRLVPPGASGAAAGPQRMLASPSFLPPPALPVIQGANRSAPAFVMQGDVRVFQNPAGIVFRSHTSHQGKSFPMIGENDVKNLGTGWDDRSTLAMQTASGVSMIRYEGNQWVVLGPTEKITFH